MEETEKLKQLIRDGGVVIVGGIRKIGKSMLAWKVAHDLYDTNELPGGVAWINYESYQTYEDCLRQTAQIFLNDRFEQSLRLCDDKVQSYLQQNKSLIIVDNLKEYNPEQDLSSWLKRIPIFVYKRYCF